MIKTRFAVVAALGYFALCGAASAADLDAKITNLDGGPVVDDKGKPVELTVRGICVGALEDPLSQEDQAKPTSGDEKLRRDALARRLQHPGDDKLTAEDVVLIKSLVNKKFTSPLLVSQVWRALEEK